MTVWKRSAKRWSVSEIEKAKSTKPNPVTTKDYIKHVSSKKLETDIQQELMNMLAVIPYKGRKLSDFIYAVPNGGYRAKRTAKILKAEGVKSGVPDLHCFVAKAPYHSLYIEMKTQTGDLSPAQQMVIPILREEGHKVVVCRSSEQALTEILNYLGVKP